MAMSFPELEPTAGMNCAGCPQDEPRLSAMEWIGDHYEEKSPKFLEFDFRRTARQR